MANSTQVALQLWFNKGIHHDNQKRYDKAIACFGHVLEIDPTNGPAMYNIGCNLTSSGRLEEAIRWYDQCLAIYPQHHDSWCNKGWNLYLLSRYVEASESLDQGLAVNRYDAALLYNKAKVEDALGHETEAAHYYRRFLYNAEPEMGKEVKEVRQRLLELNIPIQLD